MKNHYLAILLAAMSFTGMSAQTVLLERGNATHKAMPNASRMNRMQVLATDNTPKRAAARASWSLPAPETFITERPEGTYYVVYRSTTGTVRTQQGYASQVSADADASAIVVADDGSLYIENPINSFLTATWIKGHKATGDTIEVDLPQIMYSEQGSNNNTVYGYAFRLTAIDEEDGRSYVPDEASQTMKYVWRNDSLIKVDDDMLGLCLASGNWIGYGEKESVSRVVRETVAQPQNPDAAKKYVIRSYNGSGEVLHTMRVAVEDNDVYFGGITEALPDVWVKGKKDGDKVVLDAGQYMGVDSTMLMHAYLYAYEQTKEVDGITDSLYIVDTPITFSYNATTDTYSTSQNLVVNTGNRLLSSYPVDSYIAPVIYAWTDNVGAPSDPKFTSYMPYLDFLGYGGIEFQLSRTDYDDNYLDSDNLYYNLYFDGKVMTFNESEYVDVEGSMTDVPYNFKSYDFEVDGDVRRVYYYTDVTNFGLQEFYLDGDRRLVSNLVTYNASTGVSENMAAKELKSVVYTDLSGRRVSKPSKGIYVRTVEYADGTRSVNKVLMK